MEVAVLGGGHGCYAAAADLSEQGHAVRSWRRDANSFAPVLERRTGTGKGAKGRRDVQIPLPTTDLHAALNGAERVLIPWPATAAYELFRAIAPLLAPGQVVFLPAGTFGSYLLIDMM